VNAPLLNQAAAVALRIARFRAGPQDMPYAPELTRVTVAFAAIAAFLQYRLTLATLPALAHALAWVAALALFTHVILQSRGLANRFRQTFDSLLLVDSAMTVLMLPALAALAPQMARLAGNPELARTETIPALPFLLVLAMLLWNLLISGHIYRHALNASPVVGVLVAILSGLVTTSLAGVVGALLG